MPIPGGNRDFHPPKVVNGSYGLFTTTGVCQVSFLNAQFDRDLLALVQTAREAIPRSLLKVRELIQRDIDDARVRADIVPYLRPPGGDTHPRFFPPIVAAVLPGPRDQPLERRYPTAGRATAGRGDRTGRTATS